MPEIITSKDNANIKLYQKLNLSKKARNEHNMFPLEGVRLVIDALNENSELHCVFITQSASEKYSEALNLIINKIPECKIYYITDEISSKLSDTKSPQGIYAISKKLDKINIADKILTNGKFIILNNLQDPGNIGTIIRTADAVGINGIFLTDDCCDIYNPKLVRSTMGSLFRLKIVHDVAIEEVFKLLRLNNIKSYAAVIDNNAVSLTECDFSSPCAVIIGNEGNGLPQKISDLCDEKLTIKMQGNINSMNAAMAAGIIMWEMLK